MNNTKLCLVIYDHELQELGDRVLDIVGNASKCGLSPYEIGDDILDMLEDYTIVDTEGEIN